MGKVKYRIGWGGIFFLMSFALCVDFLTLIPFIGTAIGWIFWIAFTMYMMLRGINIKASRIATAGISTFIELVPVLQMLPSISAGVAVVILSVRREDRKKAKKLAGKIKKITSGKSASRNTGTQTSSTSRNVGPQSSSPVRPASNREDKAPVQ